MSENKNIDISLPDKLVVEIDKIVKLEKTNRNEFLKQAINFYLTQKKNFLDSKRLKYGYVEMGEINLDISTNLIHVDEEQLRNYEQILREMSDIDNKKR